MCSRSGIRAHKYRGTGSNYIHYPGRWAEVSRVTSYCLPRARRGKNYFSSQNISFSDETSHRLKGFGEVIFLVSTQKKIKLLVLDYLIYILYMEMLSSKYDE